MSIIISDLTYHYPNQAPLFSHLNFAVGKEDKIAVVGDNGVGKSTLLRLMAGILQPAEGSVYSPSRPYYIPQHTGTLNQSVAEALQVNRKLTALEAIAQGSLDPADYDTLADNWDIEARCRAALSYWQLSTIGFDTPMDTLSGGEKTKVFLTGLTIHHPEIILLDEPSNHLDHTGRKLLYQYIEESKATLIVVSHDITLLNLLHFTYELSGQGMKAYGGNYFFYKEQKEIEENALDATIDSEEKRLRLARKKAQEVKQRQEKRLAKGQKNKSEVPRIFKKTLTNSSENTASRLQKKQEEIIDGNQTKIAELRQQRGILKELKIDFDNASLHTGKLLVEAKQINFAYQAEKELWKSPLDFRLSSNDRIHILGDNGTGKTTLIRLLTGDLCPTSGKIHRTDFNRIYLDQNYSEVDVDLTVAELAGRHNRQHLPEHEVRLRLHRFLFPADSIDKPCNRLSGGEKMRLYLCCLMISNQTPDLIILDEPTNNLDLSSLEVLSRTIKNYRGSLLVISHDSSFVEEIGITGSITLE